MSLDRFNWLNAPLSRRSLLTSMVAAGAALSLGDLLAPLGHPVEAKATGKRASTITYGQIGAESSINPLNTLGHSESYWAWDALTYCDPTKSGALSPKLATSWKRLDDTTVEFKLRPNVMFSDGTPMTADDVKFSYDTTINEKLAVYSLLNTVATVDVVDAQTIRITTSTPDPLLERKTSLQFIVPKAVYSKVGTSGFDQSAVGTGKYVVTKYTPGQLIQFKANPHSWAGQPATPNINWQMFSNQQAAVNALQGNQIDLVELGGDPNTLQELRSSGQYNTMSPQVGGPRNLKLDTTKPPFSDKNVRLAMAYAIDVPTLERTVNKGFGTPLQGQLATPQAFGYNPKIKAYGYNVAKAKSLLAKAGYANGFKTDIASAVNYHDLMVGIAGLLEKVGIHATVVDEDGPTFIKEFYAGSSHGIFMYGANFSPLYDMDLTFRWMTGPLPPSPGKREWIDPHWDAMLSEERTTMDTSKRLSILRQMGQYLHEQIPVIPLDSQEYGYVWSKSVHNFNPSTGFFFLIDKAYKVASA